MIWNGMKEKWEKESKKKKKKTEFNFSNVRQSFPRQLRVYVCVCVCELWVHNLNINQFNVVIINDGNYHSCHYKSALKNTKFYSNLNIFTHSLFFPSSKWISAPLVS